MRRLTFDHALPLHGLEGTRLLEAAAAATLPAHTLMARAGLRVAQLALAMAPHARLVWIACGPGNNGGDGLEAASHLRRWGKRVVVTLCGDPARLPADAATSLRNAQDAEVAFHDGAPDSPDLCIDALLGIGASRPPEGRMRQFIDAMNRSGKPVLAVDVPTGLDARTGAAAPGGVRADATLALLSLKPGYFTGMGRDACGNVWFDDLGVSGENQAPAAWLSGPPAVAARPHASHKGSYGDVAVIGGAPGMRGAALLAATAALHAGAGRVYACLLGHASPELSDAQPELMLRALDSLDLRQMTAVCGCGGGDAVRPILAEVAATAARLVLDADGLNALASEPQLRQIVRARAARGAPTVLTPHPLEAARLLESATAQVQSDRLGAAQALAERHACIVVLKGSGSVVAAPGQVPWINPTGNARLATAGTGDVLAGMAGAALAAARTGIACEDAVRGAVFRHGAIADAWPEGQALTAFALARAVG